MAISSSVPASKRPRGLLRKLLRFCAAAQRVEFDLTFHWSDWGKGVLRLGHFTLLPDAFDAASA